MAYAIGTRTMTRTAGNYKQLAAQTRYAAIKTLV